MRYIISRMLSECEVKHSFIVFLDQRFGSVSPPVAHLLTPTGSPAEVLLRHVWREGFGASARYR
jgi:hypothetical protein